MTIPWIVIGLGFCLCAAYFGAFERTQPILLFVGVALGTWGGSMIIGGSFGTTLRAAAGASAVMSAVVYAAAVRHRLRELSLAREERRREMEDAMQQFRTDQTES